MIISENETISQGQLNYKTKQKGNSKTSTPHGHSKPRLEGVEQAVLICFSYLCENMHDQRPNKRRQQHHAHEIQHYADLFEYHNAVPAKWIY